MRTKSIIAGLCIAGLNASAQMGGTVNFANNYSALILRPDGQPVIDSDDVHAALYWAVSNTFVKIGDPADVGVPVPGIFAGGTRITGTNSPGGSTAQFQVRAWTGAASSYEEALSNPFAWLGQSDPIFVITGNPGGAPPTPPASLVAYGLQGFTLAPNTGNQRPSISVQPQSLVIAQGQTATFAVTASGTAPLQYQWRHEGTNLPSATQSNYTKINAQSSDAGAYAVVVSNPYGAITSGVATLTVGLPPSIVTQPSDAEIISGSNVTFNVSANGTPPLGYIWRLAGTNIAYTTSGTYTRFAAEAGGYSVVVTNSFGTTTSRVASVTVRYLLVTTANPHGRIRVVPDLPSYLPATPVSLTAEDLPFFGFNHWAFAGGGSASSNPLNVTMSSNTFITAFYDFTVPDIIVDNPAATFTGAWTTENLATDKYGSDYAHAATVSSTTPSATATFTPAVVVGGKYDVYGWWPSVGSPQPASTVPCAIVSGGVSNVFTLDQRNNEGSWNLIASGRDFSPGTNGFIRLFNNTGQTTRRVLADAIRLVYNANQPRPPVINSINVVPGQATITWWGSIGVTYRLAYKTNLTDSEWVRLPGSVPGNSAATNSTDTTLGSAGQRFYRVEEAP